MDVKTRKKSFSKSSYLKLDEVVTRVLCDVTPPGKVDAAYLFAETTDNEASVLKAGAFLYGIGPAQMVILCGLGRGIGYRGFRAWQLKLLRVGIPGKDIIGVLPAGNFPPSTDAEALGIVRYAKERDWRSFYVVASPLHQLRAFVSTVSAVIKEKANLAVYSFHGIAQSWEEYVVHSQGVLKGTRSELLGTELKKIEKYYRNGDLVSADEVLGYLDKRDGRNK